MTRNVWSVRAGRKGKNMRILVLWLLIINVLAFVLMGEDKRRAQTGARRVPERVLLLAAAAGGSPGALAGMYSWRHKTKKKKFTLGVPAILLAQLLIAGAIWLRFRGVV